MKQQILTITENVPVTAAVYRMTLNGNRLNGYFLAVNGKNDGISVESRALLRGKYRNVLQADAYRSFISAVNNSR